MCGMLSERLWRWDQAGQRLRGASGLVWSGLLTAVGARNVPGSQLSEVQVKYHARQAALVDKDTAGLGSGAMGGGRWAGA